MFTKMLLTFKINIHSRFTSLLSVSVHSYIKMFILKEVNNILVNIIRK